MAGVQNASPPVIAKAGSYTVFITPRAQLKPQRSRSIPPSGNIEDATRSRRENAAPPPQCKSPPPPVQVPPPQFAAAPPKFGFFSNAVAKVQDVHSSVDRFLADWFGLNRSKYQWALNDFYDKNGAVGASKEQNGRVEGLNTP